MRKILMITFCVAALIACKKQEEQKPAEPVAEAKPQDFEIADQKYVEIGKEALAKLSAGDVDGWMEGYTDDAVYRWSSGDSLAGKKAIADYWKDRRSNVIDSITFDRQIWLPIKVNQQEHGPKPGIWILSWYRANTKYKNGKKLKIFIHTDMHLNDANKIDELIQYIDRAPINAALAAKGKK